ncbi:hypothetical protein BH10BAC2_BH10BAC2_49720 [soil metagenome]
MKRLMFFSLLIIFSSCDNESSIVVENPTKDSVVNKEPVPEMRTTVNTKPVASFSKKVPDELNDWKFAVNIYETKETFHYLMKMQYMELTAEDTLKIPNFGIVPNIEVKAGKEPYSCIIGFLDKQNVFKEYKLVTAKEGNLSVRILHRYAAVIYEVK